MSPNLPKLALCGLSLFLTGVGHFGSNVFQWGLATTAMQCINAEKFKLQATSFGSVPSSNYAVLEGQPFLDLNTTHSLINGCSDI